MGQKGGVADWAGGGYQFSFLSVQELIGSFCMTLQRGGFWSFSFSFSQWWIKAWKISFILRQVAKEKFGAFIKD